MSDDDLSGLIRKAEILESKQVLEQQEESPDYESPEQVSDKCRDRAVWIIGGFEAIVSKLQPEASEIVLSDDRLTDGVEKVEAVLLKYPGAEVPEWLKRILVYQEEFQCGMWFAGVLYGIHKANQVMQEDQAEETETKDDDRVDVEGALNRGN